METKGEIRTQGLDERADRSARDGARSRRPLFDVSRPSRSLALAVRLDELRDAFAREFDMGAGFLWTVVLLATGAAIYLTLQAEPMFPALLATAAALVLSACYARRRGQSARVLIALAALATGLALAALETRLVAAPRLDRERTLTVTGWITDSEAAARNGRRMMVRVASMTARGLDAAHVPERIAVTARGAGRDLPVGSGVTFLARLRPPDGPTLVGGYDFARRAWFDGRGASGFVLGKIAPADIGPAPLAARLAGPLSALRTAIADRVRAALPGTEGAIAAALMVGEARAIPDEANGDLRTSGLYHIISISGLHMSLVAGGALAILRFGLALSPTFAQRHDARKVAAWAAIVVATFYLLLSGAGVATVRSWLMFLVALVAVIADRPAVTLHTVAVSACLILMVDPSSVVEPGFLMSFLAVIGLVATFEAWSRIRDKRDAEEADARPDPGRLRRWLAAGGKAFAAAAVSSAVAGLATAPVVIAEFHRGAPYGVIANLAVLPIVGIVIMPMAVLAGLLLPFGLHGMPLQIMGYGIDAMLAVAHWVANLPGGDGMTGRIHPWSQPIALAGLLWLALWRTRIRFAALAPLVIALAIAPFGSRPDVIVSDDAATVAVRGSDGRFGILGIKENAFAVATWLLADADPRDPSPPPKNAAGKRPGNGGAAKGAAAGIGTLEGKDAAQGGGTSTRLDAGWNCDPSGCEARLATPVSILGEARTTVAVVRDPRNFPEDCQRAAIIITPLVAPAACAETALVLDRTRLRATGTVELTLGRADGIRTAIGPERRPWQQGADDASLALMTPLLWPKAEAPDAMPNGRPTPAIVDPTEEPEDMGTGKADRENDE